MASLHNNCFVPDDDSLVPHCSMNSTSSRIDSAPSASSVPRLGDREDQTERTTTANATHSISVCGHMFDIDDSALIRASDQPIMFMGDHQDFLCIGVGNNIFDTNSFDDCPDEDFNHGYLKNGVLEGNDYNIASAGSKSLIDNNNNILDDIMFGQLMDIDECNYAMADGWNGDIHSPSIYPSVPIYTMEKTRVKAKTPAMTTHHQRMIDEIDPEEPKMKKKKKKKKKKNLDAERKRRQLFNEKLYTLRALVPTITKMDKVSIIRDAAQYLKGLQEDVADGEADIAAMVATLQQAITNRGHVGRELAQCQALLPSATDLRRDAAHEPSQTSAVHVTQMEKHVFHVHVHCKRSENTFVQLCRAIEAIDITVLTANIVSHGDHVYQSLTIKVKNKFITTIEDVRQLMIHATNTFGLQLVDIHDY